MRPSLRGLVLSELVQGHEANGVQKQLEKKVEDLSAQFTAARNRNGGEEQKKKPVLLKKKGKSSLGALAGR